MLLVVDVRNELTVMGVVDGDRVTSRWELTTGDHTSDEWTLTMGAMLRRADLEPTAAVLSSVVPDTTRVLRMALPGLTGSEPVVVGPGVKTGLSLQLDNAREVGSDRVTNAVAGIDRYGAPLIVVDFGTATTVDLIDDHSVFRGGAIAVGVRVAAEALVSSTSALRRVELSTPGHVVGRSTVEAVQSGSVYGFAGLVDGLVARMAAELPTEPTVIATGAFASLVAPHCSSISDTDSDLTLWGLALIHRRNT